VKVHFPTRKLSGDNALMIAIAGYFQYKKKKFLKNALLVLIAFMFLGLGAGLLWFSSVEIPDLASFDQRMLGQSTKIFDKTDLPPIPSG
jgi:cell division septal protein FtsQ